jgi:hypothetical protein
MKVRRRGPAPKSDRFTVAVSIAAGRMIRQHAADAGVTPSAAAARLLEEACRMNVEHQHGALIEAAIERVLHAKLARLEDLAVRAAIQSYRGRWLTLTELALLGDHMPASASAAAAERASQLNTESYRSAQEWLTESVNGWVEPS